MARGSRSMFGAPVFESKFFRKQINSIEESTCDIVETFRLPEKCPPLAHLVTPLLSRSPKLSIKRRPW